MTIAYVTFKSTGKRYRVEEAGGADSGPYCGGSDKKPCECAFFDQTCSEARQGLSCSKPIPIYFIEEPKP